MKRITMALGVALAFSLACAGGEETDEPTDETEEEEEEVEEPDPEPKASPKKAIQGSWQLTPTKESIRKLKVMVASASDDARKVEELGELTDDERLLYQEVKRASASEKKLILSLVETIKETRYIFQKGKLRIEVGGEGGKPVPFEVESASPKEMHVTFDQAGTKRHWYITWKNNKRADVDVQTEGSDVKFMHQLVRKGE